MRKFPLTDAAGLIGENIFSASYLNQNSKNLSASSITSNKVSSNTNISTTNKSSINDYSKVVYAQQSLIKRSDYNSELEHFLGKLKELFKVPGHPPPRCRIVFAWPTKDNWLEEYWIIPFLHRLYDDLSAGGISPEINFRDLDLKERSISQFQQGVITLNPALFIISKSLKQRYTESDPGSHCLTEVANICNKFKLDHRVYGSSKIYQLLLSGSEEEAYISDLENHRHELHTLYGETYTSLLKNLIWYMYSKDNFNYKKLMDDKNAAYNKLWNEFLETTRLPVLDGKNSEKEISAGYHKQFLSHLFRDSDFIKVMVQLSPDLDVDSLNEIKKFLESDDTTHNAKENLISDGSALTQHFPTLSSKRTKYFQCPQVNHNFIARDDISNEVSNVFKATYIPDERRLALTGMAGSGKSEIAKNYYLNSNQYTIKAWFDASDEARLIEQIITFGEKVLDISFTGEYVAKKAKHVISYLNTTCNFLLIYDNLNHPSELISQNDGKHHILITSRNECITPHYSVSIKPIDGHWTKFFNNNLDKIGSLFESDFKQIETIKPEAIICLYLISWLDTQNIPQQLLIDTYGKIISVETKLSPSLIFGEIIENIGEYSLLMFNSQSDINIDPCLQKILRLRQTDQMKMDTYTNMYHALKDMLIVSTEPENLLQHVNAMDSHREEIIEIFKRNSSEYGEPTLMSLLEQNNTKKTKFKI